MKPTDLDSLVWTRKEAAQRLKCGTTKIDQIVRSGVLKSVKHGGTRLIRESDLREYVANLPTEPSENAA